MDLLHKQCSAYFFCSTLLFIVTCPVTFWRVICFLSRVENVHLHLDSALETGFLPCTHGKGVTAAIGRKVW